MRNVSIYDPWILWKPRVVSPGTLKFEGEGSRWGGEGGTRHPLLPNLCLQSCHSAVFLCATCPHLRHIPHRVIDSSWSKPTSSNQPSPKSCIFLSLNRREHKTLLSLLCQSALQALRSLISESYKRRCARRMFSFPTVVFKTSQNTSHPVSHWKPVFSINFRI